MKIAYINLILIFVVFCFGCANELEFGLDPPPSKLVVKGTHSPQRGLVIQVFKTLNPFEWRYNDSTDCYVENAEISIFHNDSLIDQCQYLDESNCQSMISERIYSGNNYSIKVDVPGYEPFRVN